MTSADVKKEFSKAMSYQEVFMTATRLKQQGVDTVIVNKYLTARRNELTKQVSKIIPLKVTQLDTTLVDSEDNMMYINIKYLQNGNIIEWDGSEVTLR